MYRFSAFVEAFFDSFGWFLIGLNGLLAEASCDLELIKENLPKNGCVQNS
ncbi:MAG: hypothetical protein KJ939_02435 [Nanoarchaeota archaeon]|nr:hypothetical protein [Nanoarchaeota archaeon]